MARPSQKRQKSRKKQLNHLLQQGWNAIAQGQFGRALRKFQQVVKEDPQHAEGWLGVGVALSSMGQMEEGYEALHRSLELDPQQVEGWHALAQTADALGYLLEAIESIHMARRLAEEQKRPPETLRGLELTEAAFQQGLKRLAEDMGIDLSTEEGRTLLREGFHAFQEGVQALRAKEYDRAVQAFRRAVALLPNTPRAWGNLGLALALKGEYEDAEAALQKALEIQPDYEPARFNLEHLRKIRETQETEPNAFLLEYTDLKRDAPKRKELR